MGEFIKLEAGDGFAPEAYLAKPDQTPIGAIVLIQEIFGINRHIRNVAESYAREGYLVVAPAIFDRIEPGFAVGYAAEDVKRAVEIRGRADRDLALLDIEAARKAVGKLPVATLGYCWGGTLSWLAATRLHGFAASVCYYAGGIGAVAKEKPQWPVLFHFGEQDHAIPLTDVEALGANQGESVTIHLYPAGHGFNCDERPSFSPENAALARRRTLAFLGASLT